MDISRLLIAFGLVFLLAGPLWPVFMKLGLGRLPGDIIIRRKGFTLYFPILTSLVLSALLSVVVWFLNR